VKLSNSHINVDVKRRGDKVVANFMNTSIPSRLLRRLDVTDFGTPVQDIVPKRVSKGTELAVGVHGQFEQLAYQVNNQFVIDIKTVTKTVKNSLLKPNYNGKRISLNFQDIKIRAVLQLLADFTGLNIVVSDSVKGNITLRLNNVPWDQALDIILKTRGLDKRRVGSVVLIAPAAEIAAREKQQLQPPVDQEPAHSNCQQRHRNSNDQTAQPN